MTSEQLILSYGFYASGSCDCGGVRNDKYRKGPFIIYIRKTKNQFKIKRNNEVIVPLKLLNELDKALQETFPQSVAGQQI